MSLSSKISKRLLSLLQRGQPDESIPLNIAIKRNMSSEGLAASLQQIRQLAVNEEIEYIPITGTAHSKIPRQNVEAVIDMPQVEWIDVEKEAPLEELLD